MQFLTENFAYQPILNHRQILETERKKKPLHATVPLKGFH